MLYCALQHTACARDAMNLCFMHTAVQYTCTCRPNWFTTCTAQKWTVALCQMDSDGDGRTNGEELGDPNCTWTTNSGKMNTTAGITHPGNSG